MEIGNAKASSEVKFIEGQFRDRAWGAMIIGVFNSSEFGSLAIL